MNRATQSGYSLMELMFGIAIAMGVAVASIAMWRVADDRAQATAAASDAGRTVSEIRRIYNDTAQAGYATITEANLRARGADLEDLWVPAQNSYRISASLIDIEPSNRVPGGTSTAGSGFLLRVGSLSPRACEQVIQSVGREAVFARVTNQAGAALDIAGLPGGALDADIQAACNRPPVLRVELHFN